MLSTGQDYLIDLNPDAHLEVYGQELNPETWAICRSDMLIKGEDPENIVLGNSLSADGHPTRPRFDYMLANPPFGVDWKKYAEPLDRRSRERRLRRPVRRRTPAQVSDGSFLFLQHMISKMKPVTTTRPPRPGGTRLAIVFSGSPMFAGGAGSGESNIRRWIIENDWLEAVVALPDQLFYNTGINTYFWILTNRKSPERRGKVALIDARDEATKMRKSLGNKRHYLTDDTIADLTRLYTDAPNLADGDDPRVKVLPNETFGFQRITVEQPLRRRWIITDRAAHRARRVQGMGQVPHPGDRPPRHVRRRARHRARYREGLPHRPQEDRSRHQPPGHQGTRQASRRPRPRRPRHHRPQGQPAARPRPPRRRERPPRRRPRRLPRHARSTPTHPKPGSTTPRPRSATTSPSPATSTSTHHPAPSPNSTPKSPNAKPASANSSEGCCDDRAAGSGGPHPRRSHVLGERPLVNLDNVESGTARPVPEPRDSDHSIRAVHRRRTRVILFAKLRPNRA